MYCLTKCLRQELIILKRQIFLFQIYFSVIIFVYYISSWQLAYSILFLYFLSISLINTTHVSCTTIPSTEGEGDVSMNIDGNIYTGGNNVKFSYVVPSVTSLFDPDNSADGRIIKRLASVCVNYCAMKS